jgi:hypothetical protein
MVKSPEKSHDVMFAHQIIGQLHKAGSDSISVGVTAGPLVVFVFGQPSPTAREEHTRRILEVMQSIPMQDRPACEISFMDAEMYETEFKDIIPAGHWARRDSWQQTHEIMSLGLRPKSTLILRPFPINGGSILFRPDA